MPEEPSKYGAAIAESFAKRLAGILDDEKIANAVHSLKTETNSFPCSGGIVSAIFYIHFGLSGRPSGVGPQGPFFSGNAGGISIPGGGSLNGDVYTSDEHLLISKTVSFEFNATSIYTSLLFFDGSSNLLGHFQAAAKSTVTGLGGGTGAWSAIQT
jgi:Rhodococcus equi virulence-associated protein